ncbi:MAG: prepilin-type N-terminal cleavage/methylation domain-containing protein, partial [bacterium]|nr:prepilin-type N-terminal cleavage/methylation domain-containing protein [bacterium]
MKKEKGFTLVELLAVIVIIAIILAIAIPTISNYKEDRKKNLFFVLAKNIVRELDYENIGTSNSLFTILSSTNMEVAKDQIDLDKSYVLISEGGVVLNLFGKGAYEGLYLCD